MAWIDQYTWMRWKERWAGRCYDAAQWLMALWARCNASQKMRIFSLTALIFAVFGTFFVLRLLSPPPADPLSKPFVTRINDKNGDVWTLDFLKGQDFQALSKSRAKPGPPLTLKANIEQQAGNLRIEFFIVGNAGEKYVPAVLKNHRWPNPPGIEIRNSQGQLVHKGAFRFGGTGLSPYYWRVPSSYKGTVQIELLSDFGPFQIRKDSIVAELR